MTASTITRLYDSYDEAAQVVRDLEAAGVPHDDISVVGSRHGGAPDGVRAGEEDTGAGTGIGATLGTVLGGGAGLLTGIGALAIPGVGPIVAAGWLVAALTGAGVGAAAGGLLGSLTSAGVNEADAEVYAEGVRRGGTLVTVRADEAQAAGVEQVMDALGGHVDVTSRRTDYQAEGWSRHDPAAPGYTATEVDTERKRRRVRVY
jgi:hypothetical protein